MEAETPSDLELVYKQWLAIFENEGSIFSAIVEFKKNGGTKEDAYMVLDRIRQTYDHEGKDDEKVLDIMDCVCGYISPANRIWELDES